jgi:hypothetical protein
MPSIYRQSKRKWGPRVRVNGQERSQSAFKSKSEATEWANDVKQKLKRKQPQNGLRPEGTSLAPASNVLVGPWTNLHPKWVRALNKSALCITVVSRRVVAGSFCGD